MEIDPRPVKLINRTVSTTKPAVSPQSRSPQNHTHKKGLTFPLQKYTTEKNGGQKRTRKADGRGEEDVAVPIATSSRMLSSLASCCPSARTLSESTGFRRIRLRNPPPPPPPICNAIGRDWRCREPSNLDQRADKGIGFWRFTRGLGGEGGEKATEVEMLEAASLALSLSLSRVVFSLRICRVKGGLRDSVAAVQTPGFYYYGIQFGIAKFRSQSIPYP